MDDKDQEELEERVLEKLKKMYTTGEIYELLNDVPKWRIDNTIKKLKHDNRWNRLLETIKIKEKVQLLILNGYDAEEISEKLNINLRFVEEFLIKVNKNGSLYYKEKEINFENAKQLVCKDKPLKEILKICNGMTKKEILEIKILKIHRMHEQGYNIEKIEQEVNLKPNIIEKYINELDGERKKDIEITKEQNPLDREEIDFNTDESMEEDDNYYDDIVDVLSKRKKDVNKRVNEILTKIRKQENVHQNLEMLRRIITTDFMNNNTFKNIIKTLIEYGYFEYVIIFINIKEREDVFTEKEKRQYKLLKENTKEKIKEGKIIELLKKGKLYPDQIAKEVNTYETTVLKIAREKGISTKKRGANFEEWEIK